MPTLEVTVLVENTTGSSLRGEHGLSLHLRRGDLRLLLDFGQTDAFARNARALGIDLGAVDLGVLSHAHYDHADGMGAFLARNDHAPLYLSAACAEHCWSTKAGTAEAHYIGIAPGLLERFAHRLSPAPTDRPTALAPGLHLLPHTTPGLAELGKRAGMFLREGDRWAPDDFAHELTLVAELADGSLALFSSCSHAGLPVIVDEARAAFPRAPITAYVGGLHLAHATDDEVLQVSRVVRSAGIAQLWTGHCTGDHALRLLGAELPHVVHRLMPGVVFEL